MKRDNFVKHPKRVTFVRNPLYGRRGNPVREPLKKGNGGVNECFRPSSDASKADLAEFHREEMGLKKARRRGRKPNVRRSPSTSIATENRHTGKPHEHKREIARRMARP